ncbi:MAG: mercuric transporter MerT family protein [Betaproteobacteria bacterium]
MKTEAITRTSLLGSVLAALGATACCVAPLVLVTLGFGGAWLASLRALETYQPIFAAITFGLLAVAFYHLYIQPRRCKPGETCASPAVLKKQRIVFWLVLVVIISIGVFYAAISSME